MIELSPSEEDIRKRLDSFVSQEIPRLSRSFVQKLAKQQLISVNGQPRDSSYKLHPEDHVKVDFDLTELEKLPSIKLDVLYEDDDCLVIDKPSGLLTHSKGTYNPEATVATFARDKVIDMDNERAGIVHRLDRATSGVMIVAKTSVALSWLQKQFSQRKVKKTYVAVVEGHLGTPEAVIDMPIERHPRNPKTFRASSSGKPATTEYKVTSSSQHFDLVELKPLTGRTHQLRVHLKQLGHPILGDSLYGGASADRLYLHAEKLELTLPSRQRKVFSVPVPASFRTMIDADGRHTTTPSD